MNPHKQPMTFEVVSRTNPYNKFKNRPLIVCSTEVINSGDLVENPRMLKRWRCRLLFSSN
jgi:hypothetical protein